MVNINKLIDLGLPHQTSAENLCEILDEIGVKEILGARLTMDEDWYIVEIEAEDGEKYYAEISPYGFTEMVRKGSVSGDIVFMPIE